MEKINIAAIINLKFLKYLMIFGGLLFVTSNLHATHIVGGELHYRCLGDNKYEVVLEVYRDCFKGQAPYDDPAWLGVFDASGNLLDTVAMKFLGMTDTLFNADICLYVPPSLCVEHYTYKDTLTLPFIAGGYTLTYQRCCRNASIVNIIAPLEKGATYSVKINEVALKDCNSSPKFKSWPPIFVCQGKKIVFDHSATDDNGDSLVYKLCTPFDGGVYIYNPQPVPPFPPPYDTIIWKTPTYSKTNMLGGVDSLQIGLHSGLLTGTPPTIGQFVVGIRVEEYRDGKLMSIVKRDFQYNVVACSKIQSLWQPSSYNNCDSKTVSFTNTSTLSTNFKWFYKDINKGSGKDTLFSILKTPTLTVPDTGTYLVTLVAEPGSTCSDTLKQLLYFKANTLDAEFDIQVVNCLDSITINLIDKSTDPTSIVDKWNWKITTPTDTITSTLKNPTFTLFGSKKVEVTLIAQTVFGCVDTVFAEFQANILQNDTLSQDTIDICKLQSVYLNPVYFPDYSYTWVPVTGLIPPDGTIPNPLASPSKTTTYTMVYTDSTGLCHIAQNVTIVVLRSVDSFDFKIKIPDCSKDIKIVIDSVVVNSQTGTGPLKWEWVLTSPYGTQISNDKEPMFILPGPGYITITGVATTSDSCKYEVKKSLQVNVIPKNTSPSEYKICQGECVQLYPGADKGWIYKWTPPDYLDNPMAPDPLACPPVTTQYTVDYTDSIGVCIVKDTVNVIVSDSTLGVDFDYKVDCGGLKVNFLNKSTAGITDFHWEFGDPAKSTSTEVSPMFTYPSPGEYIVLLYTNDKTVCRDSIYKLVSLKPDPNKADFDYSYIDCVNNGYIQFTDKSVSEYGKIDKWRWTVDGVEFSTEQNPKYTFSKAGIYKVCLYIEIDGGACKDTICKDIEIDFITLGIPETVISCFKDSVQLNPGGNLKYDYKWSPCVNLSDCTSANPTAYYPFVEPAYSVTICYVLPNGDTCKAYKIVQVIKDSVYVKIMEDTTTCNNTITLTVTDLVNVNTLSWYTLAGDFLGSGNGLTVPLTGSEKFVVVAVSPLGCEFRDTVMVTKLQNLFIQIEADTSSFCTQTEIQLYVLNPQASYSYSWKPANLLNNATIYNPITKGLTETTSFTVEVTDANGCKGIAALSLEKICASCEDPFIFVPNAFSPNADGRNDILYVRGEQVIEEMDFIIYNRWGQKVFESRDPKNGWDGTFKGEKLGPDSFGYYLTVKCFDGKTYVNKGNVSIIR